MGVVHQSIEDGIGNGRIADDVVPVLDWKLACHDGGAASVAIFHDLEEVSALLGRHRGKSPVVEDQNLNAREALEETSMTAVTTREGERIEEPRQPLIQH
jgi:hypothetical protein